MRTVVVMRHQTNHEQSISNRKVESTKLPPREHWSPRRVQKLKIQCTHTPFFI